MNSNKAPAHDPIVRRAGVNICMYDSVLACFDKRVIWEIILTVDEGERCHDLNSFSVDCLFSVFSGWSLIVIFLKCSLVGNILK
jgi:hypothetical protein